MARRLRTSSDPDQDREPPQESIPEQQELIPEPEPVDPTTGPNPTHKWIKLSVYEKHKIEQVEDPDSAHRLICRELDDRLVLFHFKQVGVHDWQTKLSPDYRWRDAQHARVNWSTSAASWSAHMVEMPGLIRTVTGIEIYAIEVMVPIKGPPKDPLKWIEDEIKRRKPGEIPATFAERIAPVMDKAHRDHEVTKSWGAGHIANQISTLDLWPK